MTAPEDPLGPAVAQFGNTADPCLGVDGQQRIVLWNAAAEALLGYTAEEVMGRQCFLVMHSQDEQGRAFCRLDCPIHHAAWRGQLLPACRLVLRTKEGQPRAVEVSSVVLPPALAGGPHVVHYLRPGVEGWAGAAAAGEGRTAKAASGPSDLTARELQVLRLLAGDATAREVSRGLGIAQATARNHVQHVVEKLGVHGRAEAVEEARRQGLLPPSP